MSCCSNHGHGEGHHKSRSGMSLFWVALIALGGVVVYLKWDSLAGFSPYLLLLACPLMHLFMHKSHTANNQGEHTEHMKKENWTPQETSNN
ncbi:MAG: DUF2933 domain-containing protein [Formivibrio sp.]|nr:DUF2933 domain-containing protein [Formivibrio sp.]